MRAKVYTLTVRMSCMAAHALFISFLLMNGTLFSQVPLYSLRTRNLRLIYYDKSHEYLIPHMARCFENALRFHKSLFHYEPSEEVTILLQDFSDYGSAGTNTIPWNFINVGIEPFDYVYETSPTNERMNWVMNHELVHVLATDKAGPADRFFRTLFRGKVSPDAGNPMSMIYSYLTTPRWYSPRWYHEGIAVFMETWMSGGIGRAQNGYDEMVFRSMVRDTSRFYDVVGLESEGTTIDFQVGVNSYLYGTRFISYLVFRYGQDKLLTWYNRIAGSKRYFSNQFRHVYGLPLTQAWADWIRWEHDWQKTNLGTIREFPVTVSRPVLREALGSVSRACFDPVKRELIVGINYPGQIAQIVAIDIRSGNMRKICDMPSPALYYVTSLAYDPEARRLFFTTHNSTQWRDLNRVEIETGKEEVLIRGARVGDLALNPQDRSIWGVRHHNGISSLVRIPEPYDQIYRIFELPYGRDIYDIDISPEGRFLSASMVEISGRQVLVLYDIERLMQFDFTHEVMHEFEDNAPENFIFSPDGKYLYGTSYYTGVSNVFRYDREKQEMSAVTNSETGFFRPLPFSSDSLIVFQYCGKGFIPAVIPDKPGARIRAIRYLGDLLTDMYPEIMTWKLDPPSPEYINLDTLTVGQGDYRGFQNLQLGGIYPVIEGYKDFVSIGMRLDLLDAVGGIDAFHIDASYTPADLPADERFHFSFDYRHWNWTLNGSYNKTDFYDLFGPTKTSRKGYSVSVQYQGYWIYDRPRTLEYTVHLAGYAGLESLPDFQNVAASYDRFYSFKAQLKYSELLRSLGAVEEEQGISWTLTARTNLVRSKAYPRIHADLNRGFLLPLNHSSLWIRMAAGYSYGKRDDSFANFYFGGFGNNWVDYQEPARYREYYSFPGVGINAIQGTRFFKGMTEWTLPPLRFRRFGIPSFYFMWVRLALLTSGILTDFPLATRINAGAQIDIRLVTFSLFRSTLSFGYAQAFRRDHKPSDEWMISFKIL